MKGIERRATVEYVRTVAAVASGVTAGSPMEAEGQHTDLPVRGPSESPRGQAPSCVVCSLPIATTTRWLEIDGLRVHLRRAASRRREMRR